MKQCPTPEEVALYVGGDLEAIGEHIKECAECRELAEELQSDASVLSAAIEIPEDSLERLTIRVPKRIAARQRVKIWIAVASAAAALAVAWTGWSLEAPVAELPLEVAAIHAPAPLVTRVNAALPAVRKKKRLTLPEERFRFVKADATGEQLAVQVRTTDPNVVIILLGDRGA